MDASTYLSAIQSLKGETPGEKYKDLHSIAEKIIESKEETEKLMKTGESNLVPSALRANLRILVGLKLKSKDAVVEALKSDDVTIIKLALRAKWFFGDSNELANVQYFSEKLLPFVSLRTRLELIKALSKCLKAQQAQSFHGAFVERFGCDQALPLLVGCGEDYVYDEIFKSKILLPERMLKDLYRKYPQMIIRYLRTINDNAAKKWSQSCKHASDVDLTHYVNFLPNLVKNHTQVFVEFVLGIADGQAASARLGSTRAEYFLRNAAEALVKDPQVFLAWLPLKLVKSKLSKQQYDAMLINLFPKEPNKLCTSAMVNAIKTYYPKEAAFQLYRANYKKVYACDILQHKDLFEDECIYEVLPVEIKAEYSRRYVNSLSDKATYTRRVYQLPPNEAIPLLKEQVKKSTLLPREVCLQDMLRSCDLYRSEADLLEVLRYYNSRHKNEQAQVLLQFLETLAGSFDNMKSLDKQHWQVIQEIVQRAYVKGDLTVANWYFNAQSLFDPMLRHFLRESMSDAAAEQADKPFLDTIVNVILEYYCERNNKWDFIVDAPELEEACLEKFLTAVPQKYPDDHAVWRKDKNKLSLTSYFVEKLGKFNEKNLRAPLDPRAKASKVLAVHSYPWLEKFATELFIDKEHTSRAHCSFKESLRKYCPEFYRKLIDEHADLTYSVATNDALAVLKRDPSKISLKINEYVADCRTQLAKGGKCTRCFVMALKWHQDLPLKFVQKCLAEIEEKGSILILAILLDGTTLTKIIEPYFPKESNLELDTENAKKNYELVSSLPRALNYANPPPPLEALISLCKGDYLSLALQTLSSIAQRIPIDRVLSFANHLANNAISVKKAAIRLIFQVSPKPQVREFLSKICKEEKNPGIREVVAKMVHQVFSQTPSRDSWQLMKEFIHGLLHDDKNIYDVLKNLKSIHADYVTDYLLEILKKIESFSDEELNQVERSNLVRSFFNEIDDPQVFNKLPENVITEIITKYLFDSTLNFIYNIYLFSDEQKFEGRLKVFMGILTENVKRMSTPDSERPRSYTTLKKVHDRFGTSRVFDCLKDNKNIEMNRRLISSVLANTSVRKELECFINFNIYQIFFDTSDAKSFGEKCAKNIDDLVKIYKNECVIENYGNCMVPIVNKTYDDQVFDIIDGMTNYRSSYGVFIGLKLLQTWKVADYDERYDKFVEAAMNSGDLMVQALLYNFLRGINFYG